MLPLCQILSAFSNYEGQSVVCSWIYSFRKLLFQRKLSQNGHRHKAMSMFFLIHGLHLVN